MAFLSSSFKFASSGLGTRDGNTNGATNIIIIPNPLESNVNKIKSGMFYTKMMVKYTINFYK